MGSYIVPKGGKPLTHQGYSCPGPADYLPKVDIIKHRAPQFSIVGRTRQPHGKGKLPGPLDYNTSRNIVWRNRNFSLEGRYKSFFDIEAERSVGLPGKYNVEHLATGQHGPKFKMGTRAGNTGPADRLVLPVDTKGFETPGPNYRPNSGYWGRGTKKSFGICWTSKTAKGPGPADYDISATSRGPSYSFGVKLPEPLVVQQGENKFSPAANTYNLGTTVGKAPAISIAFRPTEPKGAFKLPCPFTYTVRHRYFDNPRTTTLSYKWFEINEPERPGPADYQVKRANQKSSPSYSCRKRVKPTFPDSEHYKVFDDIPGPGTYNPEREFDRTGGPAYTLRKRLEPHVDTFPGPSAYAPEKRDKPGSNSAPSFSMARRLEQPDCMKKTPGPGEYSPATYQTEKGKYTMTSRPKGKQTFVNPVAPNHYILPRLMSGKNKGVVFKSRASPYVYSGFRTNKPQEPRDIVLPPLITCNSCQNKL